MPQVISAPQSWYRGCDLQSPEQNSYDPNTTSYCPPDFSQNSTWSMPGELTMPSLAPNSGVGTSVATAALNGGLAGLGDPVAGSPGTAQDGQSLGPASMAHAVPTIIPPNWNTGNPPAPSIADRLSAWACANPGLAALSLGGVFLIFAKGGRR